jgi:uncharacterized SAM-dependent methyltransferase
MSMYHLEQVKQVEQDFIDLFTKKKSAHIGKYIYMHRPEIYDQIADRASYYPYRVEASIIANYASDIVSNIKSVSNVIEIGPGSESPIIAKSVPMIVAMKSVFDIKNYTAIDLNKEYASSACDIIREKFDNLTTDTVIADFNIKNDLAKVNICASNNIIMSFGGTLICSGTEEDVENGLENISNILASGEYFIFGVDLTNNENTLAAAYDTNLSYELLLNAMYGIKYAVNDLDFDARAFDLVFKWDKSCATIKLSLRANKSQKICINNHDISINKDDEFHMLNSRKTFASEVELRLRKFGMTIEDSFELKENLNSKFAILKIRKI